MGRVISWLVGLDAGELEGADSWFPAFSAAYNNWIILGLFVVFAALIALTVISYLREGDISRRVKLTIAGIRIAVLVLIVAVLFQPELVLRYKKNHYHTVAVLFDDSLSMSVKDRYARQPVRQAVAAKLGVGEMDLETLSRGEIVRRILARQGGPLGELSKEHRLMLLRFSTFQPGSRKYVEQLDIVPCGAESGQELAQAEGRIAAALKKLITRGFETNHSLALRGAARALQGQRVAGIVLVGDGQSTGGTEATNRLASAMAHLRQRGIRVATVAVGDDVPPQNVAVLELQAPVEVRRGSTIEMTAFLTNRNCGSENVKLTLKRRPAAGGKWADTGVSKQVRLVGAPDSERSEPQEVRLRVEATDLGEFVYKVETEPLEGEFSAEDNFATAKLKVSDAKIRVLLVSGDGGWEYVSLRRFLLRAPDRYAVSVWQQDADKEFNQEASSKDMRLTHLPRKRAELFKYEVVILYDPDYREGGFDGTLVGMLDDFVAYYHGGLCYIASNKHTDLNLTGTDDVFKPLMYLLPVALDRQSLNIAARIHQAEPVARKVVPTAAGQDHASMRFGRNARDTLGIWDLLPGVYWWHPVRKLKPLATTLAVSSDRTAVTTAGSMRRTPLIAVQYYGKGRSMYMGFDETWRWLALSKGVYYRKFWANVVDFLAAGRFQKKRVIINTGADRFAVEEEVTITVEVYDPQYKPLADETFDVTLIDTATGERETITLDRKAEEPGAEKKDGESGGKKNGSLPPGHYRKKVTLKKEGTFRLTARQDDPAYKNEVAEKIIRVTLPAEEFKHPEADPANLKTIASEGRFLDIQDSDALPALVAAKPMTVYNDVPHSLWDSPLTIVLIVSLLAAEWICRKKYNMA